MQHNQYPTPPNGHPEGPDEAMSGRDTEVSIEGRHYVLATDGACKGNPGTGGWGVVIQLREGLTVLRQRCLAGQELFTTNNRMELMGPIRGLTGLKEAIPTVVISDSEYVVLGMRGRLEQWEGQRLAELRWFSEEPRSLGGTGRSSAGALIAGMALGERPRPARS
ncbi:MAG TPA: RNase H family protein [Pelagibacterium sp.]|uniref:RNase H family protein n=1 Tax=Pelagibacterium sp. TaxID=1967288 RepID=UPI002CA547EE|nr:RNase H family protein [Pelagibacterium sp.]HWJ86590.1 RNase H family protein [Pelagibacterium sp.]